MSALASSKRVIKIPNFREVEDFITTTLRGEILSCSKTEHKPRLDADCYTLNTTEIWSCSYHAPIALKFAENDYFRIQLQHQGDGITRLGRHDFPITADHAIISSVAAELNFGEGFQQKALRINRANLIKKMATLIDMPLIDPLMFQPAIDCNAPRFQLFAQTLQKIEHISSLPHQDLPSFIFAELEQSLFSAILGSFDHNYTRFFDMHSPGVAPWQVRRVEEYIWANWDQPIMIEEIVAIAGCSVSSLFRSFRQSRGYTPMEFVKRVRLQQARNMLINGEETSVTRVALACGLWMVAASVEITQKLMASCLRTLSSVL